MPFTWYLNTGTCTWLSNLTSRSGRLQFSIEYCFSRGVNVPVSFIAQSPCFYHFLGEVPVYCTIIRGSNFHISRVCPRMIDQEIKLSK
jgi:hypothetical protein